MKYTPVANNVVVDIESALLFMEVLKSSISASSDDVDGLIKTLGVHSNTLRKIDTEGVKEEFWSIAGGLENPEKLRSIYEVKFRNLLAIDSFPLFDFRNKESEVNLSMLDFMTNFNTFEHKFYHDDLVKIVTDYFFLVFILSFIKKEIVTMLDECSAFHGAANSQPIIAEQAESSRSNFSIAYKRKTDFIKIVSAMYDAKVFVNSKGEPATNKQKLMDELGSFLNDDFSAYSTYLSQAKDKEEKTFLKPFKEIEKEALRYFNSVENK